MFKKIAKSKWIDVLGLIIVVFCAWKQGYLVENLQQVTHWGGWSYLVPFGIISTIASMISIMSDRLTARLNNLGNWIGLIAVVTSGCVDYILGDPAAIITYPVTFIIQAVAIKVWMNSKKYKANRPPKGKKAVETYIYATIFSIIFSYVTNAIGFGGTRNAIFYLTVVVFAMSLMANILNAKKLTAQWPFWLVYNVSQLFKAGFQGNWSNFGKYIYYIFNAVCGIFLWKKSNNRDSKKVASGVKKPSID